MHSILDNNPNDVMPPPPNNPLTDSQIALIQQWINQGAQNTTNCASTCDTTAFLFSADIAPILSTYCNGCHSGPFPDAGINTTTYAGVQTIAQDGSLLGSIEHNSNFVAMPKNAAKMDACNITKIRKWIQAGAQNN
jgi:ribosomal protein S16